VIGPPDTLAEVMAVIPAFNEEASIGVVVSAVRSIGITEVTVVDDCSTDSTAVVASQAGAKVLSLADNGGAWLATQAGLRFALERGFKQAVTLDADGQHFASLIPDLLSPISEGIANTVVGACQERGNRRRHLAWAWLRTLSGVGVGDITSGMRAYDKQSLDILTSRVASFINYQDVGLLLLLRSAGLSITEVSVEMAPRSEGKSKIFDSWLSVASYLWYSTMLSITKRSFRFPEKTRRRQ